MAYGDCDGPGDWIVRLPFGTIDIYTHHAFEQAYTAVEEV